MKEVNAEAMAEILEGFGIHTDKYAEIAEEFSHHLECMRDSYIFATWVKKVGTFSPDPSYLRV